MILAPNGKCHRRALDVEPGREVFGQRVHSLCCDETRVAVVESEALAPGTDEPTLDPIVDPSTERRCAHREELSAMVDGCFSDSTRRHSSTNRSTPLDDYDVRTRGDQVACSNQPS